MFITIAFYLQNIWHDGYGHDAVVVFCGMGIECDRAQLGAERARALTLSLWSLAKGFTHKKASPPSPKRLLA